MRYPFDKEYEISTTFTDAGHYDFKTPLRTPVYAICGMKINFAGVDKGRGIKGTDGYYQVWRYWHFDELLVKTNQWVDEGTLLGYSGGYPPMAGELSSGPHCHIDCEKGNIFIDWLKEITMPDQLWIDIVAKAKKFLTDTGKTDYIYGEEGDIVKRAIDRGYEIWGGSNGEYEPVGTLYRKKP
jgi:murein DD-endopeptidase MepM/ murein hydrolase activator NlpD